MRSLQQNVWDFHRHLNRSTGTMPATIGVESQGRRKAMIEEEIAETLAALETGDIVKVADGICDSVYTLIGLAVEMGIDLDPVWDQVHRSNMAKINNPEHPSEKSIKPEGWVAPDVQKCLDEQNPLDETYGWQLRRFPWPQSLEPTILELEFAHCRNLVPPCPHCGKDGALLTSEQNPVTKLWIARMYCNGWQPDFCGSFVSSCGGYSRSDAQRRAIERWCLRAEIVPDERISNSTIHLPFPDTIPEPDRLAIIKQFMEATAKPVKDWIFHTFTVNRPS